jgi:hypothetical protein
MPIFPLRPDYRTLVSVYESVSSSCLKSFYGVTDDNSRRIDISVKLVLRMMDEDDTVKDLAVKTVEELWFPNTTLPASAMKGKSSIAHNPHDKGPLLSKVASNHGSLIKLQGSPIST